MSLDMHDIQYLSNEQKERYLQLQRFFESDHWKLLQAWASANHNQWLLATALASSWEVNRMNFGQSLAYERLFNLEKEVDNEYANYAKEAQEAVESGDEEGNQ